MDGRSCSYSERQELVLQERFSRSPHKLTALGVGSDGRPGLWTLICAWDTYVICSASSNGKLSLLHSVLWSSATPHLLPLPTPAQVLPPSPGLASTLWDDCAVWLTFSMGLLASESRSRGRGLDLNVWQGVLFYSAVCRI